MAIDFLKLLETLADSKLEFVIVGGVAARLHGSTRLTRDLDVVPRLEAKTWARVVDLLWDAGRPQDLLDVETLEAIKRGTRRQS